MRNSTSKNLLLLVFISITLLSSCSSVKNYNKLAKVIESPTTAEDSLIAEGVEQHNSGRYEDAIGKYRKVLETNPENAIAMYETAFSFNSLSKTDSALMYLTKAMENKGDVYAFSCDLAGTISDNNGNPEKALKYYNQGIEYDPEFQILYFNRGVTYFRMQKYGEAKKDFQTSIKLNPFHPGSHYLLSSVYLLSGQEIPSSFSALTYLILYSMNISENPFDNKNDNRIETAKNIIETAFAINDKKKSEYKPDKNKAGKGIYVKMDANSLFDDFFGIDMFISMKVAIDARDTTGKKISGLENTSSILSSYFAMLKPDKEKKSFAGNFYSPFFYSIFKKDFSPLIAHFLYYAGNQTALQKYMAENSIIVEKFKSWLLNYDWNVDAKSDLMKIK